MQRRASSLIELVIVVLVLGIIVAAVAPRWAAQLARYRVDAAAKRIASDLERIRSAAYAQSLSHTITFDVAASHYQIDSLNDMDHPGQSYTVNLSDVPYYATVHLADFGGKPSLTFNAFGMPDYGGRVVVRVGSAERTVQVMETTGEVSIK